MEPVGLSGTAFTIPGLRLVNETNAREHWAVRSNRAKEQRDTARLSVHGSTHIPAGRKYEIHICRVGPRKLDSDNLAASAKHVRDGIADALGVNDGDESRAIWHYAQAPGKHGVYITIYWTPEEKK